MQVIGIDEVGRGAWAGPVVAGAVLLGPAAELPGVTDSKLLTPLARERADRLIRVHAQAIGLGWVSASELNSFGLSWAVRTSGLRALEALLAAQPLEDYEVCLDGTHNYLAGTVHPASAIVKADATVLSVSAASIVAKVARDRYLEALDRRHPEYGFAKHKGYGTAAHLAALTKHGITDQHRTSYRPIAALVRETQ